MVWGRVHIYSLPPPQICQYRYSLLFLTALQGCLCHSLPLHMTNLLSPTFTTRIDLILKLCVHLPWCWGQCLEHHQHSLIFCWLIPTSNPTHAGISSVSCRSAWPGLHRGFEQEFSFHCTHVIKPLVDLNAASRALYCVDLAKWQCFPESSCPYGAKLGLATRGICLRLRRQREAAVTPWRLM